MNEFQSSTYVTGEGELHLTTIGLFHDKLWITVSIFAGLVIYALFILCGIVAMTKIEHQPPISLPLDNMMEDQVGIDIRADARPWAASNLYSSSLYSFSTIIG